jgi:hypothetical protein
MRYLALMLGLAILLSPAGAAEEKRATHREYQTQVPEALQEQVNTAAVPQGGQMPTGIIVGLIVYALAILAFGGGVVYAVVYLISRDKLTDAAIRVIGLVTVAVLAPFLVVAGYSPNPMAGAIGLLGTALGFLFGKALSPPRKPEASSPHAGGTPSV